MDKDGVDVSVVLNYGWSTQSLCTEINDYILESVARYPETFGGLSAVLFHPEDEAALKEVERCIKGGAKGIGELRLDTHLKEQKLAGLVQPIVGHNH